MHPLGLEPRTYSAQSCTEFTENTPVKRGDRENNHASDTPQPTRKCKQRGDEGATVLSRIKSRVVVDANGCWLWQGAKNSRGYGSLRVGGRKGKSVSIHRLVMEARFGAMGAEQMVLHHCDVKACCNPDHLYVGTRADNARDAKERGQYRLSGVALRNAGKTHCPQGHTYDEANTYVHPRTGERQCRACRRERAHRHTPTPRGSAA